MKDRETIRNSGDMGERLPYEDLMPGEGMIDDVANPFGLEEKVAAHLEAHPTILEQAKEKGKDVIAFTSSNGKRIIIGVGVAALVSGAVITGIVIYKHTHRKP